MLLRAELRRIWGAMPEAVLASPLTSRGGNLPSERTSAIFRELLPMRSQRRTATAFLKVPEMWDNDVSAEVIAEVEELLIRHTPELEAAAEMFEVLPRIAEEEVLDLPAGDDERLFKIAYRSAVRHLAGDEIDGVAIRALLDDEYGTSGDEQARSTRTIYDEMLAALGEPPFRATLEQVVDAGERARVAWQAPAYDAVVWDDAVRALCELLAAPGQGLIITLDHQPGWEAVLDAGADRWGLRREADNRAVVVGERVPNALPPPLDRTVAERLGAVLGQGTSGRRLREAGRGAHELLVESAARACEPLGLSEPGSRSLVALGMLAAELLQAEAPNEVTKAYGGAAERFGNRMSRGFGSAQKLLGFYDPSRKAHDEAGVEIAREGDLGAETEAAEGQFKARRAAAEELRARLDEESADRLVLAVWRTAHFREVFGLPPTTVAEGVDLVLGRARHVSKEICSEHLKGMARAKRLERLPLDIVAVCRFLSPEDARALVVSTGPLSAALKASLEAANQAARAQDPTCERVTVDMVRQILRRPDGNG